MIAEVPERNRTLSGYMRSGDHCDRCCGAEGRLMALSGHYKTSAICPHVTREWNLQAILLFARISRANWRLLPAPRLARIVLSNACHCFRRSLLHELSTNL